ncbi:hypothetical protein [Actinocatenispora sera]|jgi:hypothetical protein|uniref:Uncharacterized protein n=1 Tax=Actinocatenispora sera TaxID=390989 RepID=A0A810L815_9ACTN|nr:hypothetical protein [Actinocatenispora sera]BCJ31700.1 hypothetical protein Asera_58080 [Actinocatenispora sera]
MSDEAPRVCGRCNRPLVARDRSEYTDRRAVLVGERGLCTCPRDRRTRVTTGRPSTIPVAATMAADSGGAVASRADGFPAGTARAG